LECFADRMNFARQPRPFGIRPPVGPLGVCRGLVLAQAARQPFVRAADRGRWEVLLDLCENQLR
jgi:hypothetical protein